MCNFKIKFCLFNFNYSIVFNCKNFESIESNDFSRPETLNSIFVESDITVVSHLNCVEKLELKRMNH